MDQSVASRSALIEIAGSLVSPSLILALCIARKRSLNVRVISCLTTPFIVLGLLLAPWPQTQLAGQLFLQAGSEGCYVLLTVVACGIAYTQGVSGAFVGGAAMGAVCAGMLAGSLARTLLGEGAGAPASWALEAAATAVFVALTAALFFGSRVLFGARSIKSIVAQEGSAEERADALVGRWAEAYRLTPSEQKVLALMARGLDRQEVAEELFISPSTLRVHISHLCRKAGFSSAADLGRAVERELGGISGG